MSYESETWPRCEVSRKGSRSRSRQWREQCLVPISLRDRILNEDIRRRQKSIRLSLLKELLKWQWAGYSDENKWPSRWKVS